MQNGGHLDKLLKFTSKLLLPLVTKVCFISVSNLQFCIEYMTAKALKQIQILRKLKWYLQRSHIHYS